MHRSFPPHRPSDLTCLYRVVEKPVDVFLIMQSEFRRLTGQTEYPYAQTRRQAEQVARDECIQSDDESSSDREIGITDIYKVLCRLSGDPVDLIPEFIRIEVEARSPRTGIINRLTRARMSKLRSTTGCQGRRLNRPAITGMCKEACKRAAGTGE